MNQQLLIPKNWRTMMKMTVCPLLLLVIFGTLGMARDLKGQEILNRTVSVVADDTELKDVLTQLERQADVKFVYSTKIQSKQRITLNLTNRKLSAVLDQILRPLSVDYEVIESRILLKKATPAPTASSPNVSAATVPLSSKTTAEKNISGKVIDKNNVPLAGVNIAIKGTTRGTSTNAEGEYTLANVADGNVLVFSFIGYVPQEATVGAATTYNLTLAEDTQNLNEVVVTALGIKRDKRALGYSVQEIKGEDLSYAKEPNVANSLAGKMAGVQVTRSA
ncbi:MAG: SusC/RagA family TonB-linked outer membrane protein, partial [Runella slithyformis]